MKRDAAAPALAAMVLMSLTGCAAIRTATTRSTEAMLAAAGFQVEPADTPEKAAHLQTLRPRKIAVEHRGGEPSYVYPDPHVCGCMYVGTETQYREYQRLTDEALQRSMSWAPWGPWSWGLWGSSPWW
jgi:hypothetical protein